MNLKLRNRLEVLMKDSGISTFEEMADRLTNNQGWSITRSALSRKFRDDNVTLTMKMIEAICNELQCLPGDLFETQIANASDDDIAAIQNRVMPFRYGNIQKATGAVSAHTSTESVIHAPPVKPASEPMDLSSILGPKVTHLSADKLKGK